jgi:hypothetical protein
VLSGHLPAPADDSQVSFDKGLCPSLNTHVLLGREDAKAAMRFHLKPHMDHAFAPSAED